MLFIRRFGLLPGISTHYHVIPHPPSILACTFSTKLTSRAGLLPCRHLAALSPSGHRTQSSSSCSRNSRNVALVRGAALGKRTPGMGTQGNRRQCSKEKKKKPLAVPSWHVIICQSVVSHCVAKVGVFLGIEDIYRSHSPLEGVFAADMKRHVGAQVLYSGVGSRRECRFGLVW
jgi:hypothetical protein